MRRKAESIDVPSLRTLVAVMAFLAMVFLAIAPAAAREYTLNADFDEGVLIGVEHDTVPDQLQLSVEIATLPFIWVPNQGEGTVSKVDTETGDELGRYRVGPAGDHCSPSRTTVDLGGNCWVGNRNLGTVVLIGLLEAGQWIDRNGNGVADTSQDTNGDGDITDAELLPWGQDECVLYEVVLIPGKQGTFVPGTYTGGYDYDEWGDTAPRGLAIDASNNLWAGTWNSMTYYYIDGATGSILDSVDVSLWDHHAYGAVIDGSGILWSSAQARNHILRLDPSTSPPTTSIVKPDHFVYGMGIDYLGHLFISGWESQKFSRVDILADPPVVDWTLTKPELRQARGVACTSDNDVWVASTWNNSVYRYDNGGNLKATFAIDSGVNGPTGVAVDAAGKVWACNLGDDNIVRIDPATNTVDLIKTLPYSGGHYSYSDMTGIVARTITTKTGTWTVIHDSGAPDTPWGTVSWTSDEPAGTSVTVSVRSSNDSAWSAAETAANGVPLTATPDGRYLEITTTLKITSGDESPILYDLTVERAVIPVAIDIKPESCPNPLNVRDRGDLAVAILGTLEFDAFMVDPASIRLEGVPPLRWDIEDVATPIADNAEACECTTEGPDGFYDLGLKFDSQAVVAAIGEVSDGDVLPLLLTGNLRDEYNGTAIEGSDCVIIVLKGNPK
jgi:streptogramin lyase